MSSPTVETIWSASDYSPTAERLAPAARDVAARAARLAPSGARVMDLGAGHGHLAAELAARGFAVTAVEPAERMLAIGRTRVPTARWLRTTGEDTGLPDGAVDCVASSFGSMFCDPVAGPAEWARVLRPGGALVMSAWGLTGFLAEMTDRMMAVMAPGADASPPHMLWGETDVAESRLAPHFHDIRVESQELPWCFESVEAGMELYLYGSPTHAFSLAAAGERREELMAALRAHLEECAGPDGSIRSSTGYCVITARR